MHSIDPPVIHVTEGLDLRLGGTTEFIATLCTELSGKGFRTEVWAPAETGGDSSCRGVDFGMRRFEPGLPFILRRCPGLAAALYNLSQKPLLIHQHGLWLGLYRSAAAFARKKSVPHVISLHGMLEPWALGRNKYRKKIAWLTFQKKDIHRASCLHVATEREAENVRGLGIKTPIAVIPNAVGRDVYQRSEVRDQRSVGQRAEVWQRWPELEGKKIILTLGRIHPVKGLDFFARVWGKVAPEAKDWIWVIAGPDEGGYRRELENLLKSNGVSDRVVFTGLVQGGVKEMLLSACSILAVPSYLESFSLVTAEALSFGKPVLASKNIPWPDLEACRCGWWVEQNPEKWVTALREALAMDERTRNAMGERGKNLVAEKYTIAKLVESMKMLYGWVLKKEEKPCFIC